MGPLRGALEVTPPHTNLLESSPVAAPLLAGQVLFRSCPLSTRHTKPLAAGPGEHAELQRQGAKAAARGDIRATNPMLDTVNQPEATGESNEVWTVRRDAWDRGHTSQVTLADQPLRSMTSAAPPSGPRDEALFGVTRVLTFAGANGLTEASGFFFERDARLYLVTSRHVLFDEQSGHAPDRIEIEMHTNDRDLTRTARLSILLYRDGMATWHQASDSGGEIDVATIEIDQDAMPTACVLQPFKPQHLVKGFDHFDVGDRLAIPGFPLGFFDTVHHLPVVRQASIASFYGIRFQGQGLFLTDARMHRGSSGSPVLARLEGDGSGHPRWSLLGVHSSRMDMATRDLVQDESLGLNCAWYADVLMTLTAGDR
jgi:S1-C subfamily serine protease